MNADRPLPTPIASTRRSVGRPVALFAVAALAIVSAACSSSPAARSVARLPGSGSSTAASVPSAQQSDQDLVSYAHCLRNHGVNEPDPFQRPGHSGLTIEIPPSTPSTSAALKDCNHFVARLVQAKEAAGAQAAAPHLAALTDYARCMRSRDIPMLDPTIDGILDLGSVPGISNGFGRYSPQFRAADSACRHLLPAGVHDDGTGP
jgi:hypothetical protein